MNTVILNILEREGLYTEDQGGPTKYGITQATYSEFLGKQVSKKEIQNLSYDDAVAFYEAWEKKFMIDQIKLMPLQDLFFDCIINHGPGNAVKWIQKAAIVQADGVMGPKTVAAINAEATSIYYKLLIIRIKFYGEITVKNFERNGASLNGWLNRACTFIRSL